VRPEQRECGGTLCGGSNYQQLSRQNTLHTSFNISNLHNGNLVLTGTLQRSILNKKNIGSVSDLHPLFADPDPAFLVNANPDLALKMNLDPDSGEVLANIFYNHIKSHL
jgi:hypothetical protein